MGASDCVYLVDASNHDWARGPMDLAAMARAGISAITHKATDGLMFYRDPYFGGFAVRARTAGFVAHGAYHVLWPGSVAEQARWFVNVVTGAAPWWRDAPFMWQIDAEHFSYLPRPPSINEINEFGRVVHDLTGAVPLAYAPGWLYGAALNQLVWPQWESNYGPNPVGSYRAMYPGNTSSRWVPPARLLQYGSRLTVATQTNCDVSAYRGSPGDLLALIGHPGGGPAPASPPEEDTDMFEVPVAAPAFDAAGQWKDPDAPGRTVPVPLFAVGSGSGEWGPAWVQLLASGPATVRVTYNGGGGWGGQTVTLQFGTPQMVPLPDGTTAAYIGRVDGDPGTAAVNATIRYAPK